MKIAFQRKERTGGALHVRVDGAFAVELQHIAPLVIERVNAYYGYTALARLALHQAPVGNQSDRIKTSVAARAGSVEYGPNHAVQVSPVDGIEDQGLRTALRRLAEAIRDDSSA